MHFYTKKSPPPEIEPWLRAWAQQKPEKTISHMPCIEQTTWNEILKIRTWIILTIKASSERSNYSRLKANSAVRIKIFYKLLLFLTLA